MANVDIAVTVPLLATFRFSSAKELEIASLLNRWIGGSPLSEQDFKRIQNLVDNTDCRGQVGDTTWYILRRNAVESIDL